MGFRLKPPRIEHLERYIAHRRYDRALEAVTTELERDPRQFNLLLRKAEILGLAGDRDGAVQLYLRIAEKQARDGYYARAIALYKKILRLDPSRKQVHSELARLIEEERQSQLPLQERLRRQSGGAAHAMRAAGGKATRDRRSKELRASAFFEAFPADALREVLTSTWLRSYDEGDIIVTEGEIGSSMFLVVAGEVKVFTRGERGEHIALAELGPGDFFGEISLLTGRPRTATITAKTPVTAIELSREDVDRIALEHPEVPSILQEFYSRRAQEAVEAVIGSGGRSESDQPGAPPEDDPRTTG